MHKRHEYWDDFDEETKILSRLVKIIPDIDLLRRLLDSGLLYADDEEQGDDDSRGSNVPISHRQTHAASQDPIYNGQLMQE